MKSKFKYYEVGGCVRDSILGLDSKDIDLVAIGGSYQELEADVVANGGKIFISKPEYFTIRCDYPNIGPCDIRLARKDGHYSDGRRPDAVFLADSLQDDLSTRDFTVNAIARDIETGELIDPFGGAKDLAFSKIRCVGCPEERFKEDSLRMLRAIRFALTKGFSIDFSVKKVLNDFEYVKLLDNVSGERVREELIKMFSFDTLEALAILREYPIIENTVLCKEKFGIWLKPTQEKI